MRQNVVKNIGDTETSQEFNEGLGQELNSCIEGVSLSFDSNDDKQLLQSMSIVTSNRMTYKEITGSSGTAYIIQTYQDNIEPLKNLVSGCKIRLYISNTNTTTTPTIKIDNLPDTYAIKQTNGNDLTLGMIESESFISLIFDGTDFLLENNVFSEKNINELNTYTVSSYSSNTYNLQNLVKNPLEYYNGLVVVFKASNTCASTPKININSLGDINIVDIQKETLTESEILQNDVIECIYYDTEFHIIKKSSKIKNNNDVLSFQNNNGEYISSVNINDNDRIDSNTTLTDNDINKIISIDNTSSLAVTMPLTSNLDNNAKFIFCCESNSDTIFQCDGSDQFIVDNSVKTSFTANVSNTLIIISKVDDELYSVSYTRKSTTDLLGSVKKATQTQVDAGTDPDLYITPETLYNTPFIANLNIIYPIGSTKEFYSNTDPDPNTLTGYSSFTWERVASGIAYITDDNNKMATTEGSQDTVGGTTNGTTLTIQQMPSHTHSYDLRVPGAGTNISPAGYGGVGTTSGNTSSTGGGQPHSHVLNLKTTYYSKWVRTA